MSFFTSSVASSIAAYLILGCFLVIEPLTRKNATARSLRRGEFDRGSTLALGIAFGLSISMLLLTLWLNAFGIGLLPRPLGAWVGWSGVTLMLLGLILRLQAARILGAYFTRTLVAAADQPIIQEGPYRVVRHPGYLGDLLMWIGASMAPQNGFAIAFVTCVMLLAYAYRIRREEVMLRATLREPYVTYMARTRRLTPFIY
jgi:protein-S-isoprenylcysteine O-methyltransferase Ste14